MKEQKTKNAGAAEREPAIVKQKVISSAIVYDKSTGRILETHRVEALEDQSAKKLDESKLLKEAAEDDYTMNLVQGRKKDNLAVIDVPIDVEQPRRMMVDIGSGKLVSQPCLQLSAAKTELEGDGKDSTTIEVSVVDAKGKQLRGFDSEIEIRTSRGKLSARGGRINLSKGTASIKLTSVAETVSRVRVSARSLGIPCERAFVELSFM